MTRSWLQCAAFCGDCLCLYRYGLSSLGLCMSYTTSEIERSQKRIERLFPIHWLMEGEAMVMRTRVGNLLVSTVPVSNKIRGDHYETMVFHCDSKGKVTDWSELFCTFTNDEVVGHENGVAFAQPYRQGDTVD